MQLSTITDKVRNAERLTREEGLSLLTHGELLELGECANIARYRKNPEPRITFVVDTNPNYTNISTATAFFARSTGIRGKRGSTPTPSTR